jgi:hypothetical protein
MRAKTKRSKHPAKKAKRPIGLAKNKLKITKSFFKPLPDELLDALKASRETAARYQHATCTFLWIASGSSRLSKHAAQWF